MNHLTNLLIQYCCIITFLVVLNYFINKILINYSARTSLIPL